VRAFGSRKDLSKLATLFATDKWGSHWYTQHYQRYFEPMRKRPVKLLEIGIGGYKDAGTGGESLRMWKAFFRSGQIVGIDIEDKRHFSEDRIDIHVCDQTDEAALTKLSEKYGGFDIVVDDGSHLNEHIIRTFHIMFPLLRDGGIYSIEDVQTSYWPTWGGGMGHPESAMEFFKKLADGVNHVEFPIEGYDPSYFERNIAEIAFFHNLVIIRKAKYVERSNAPKLIEAEKAAMASTSSLR
jgi:demethylmacrocin O-methyltransferase